MGINVLQELLESDKFPACLIPVNLNDLCRKDNASLTVHQRKTGLTPKFTLVVDGECCLNRLYGGYLSDWVCGGQWNRMVHFITSLRAALLTANIDMVVFFNGCVEPQRIDEWARKQQEEHKTIMQVLKQVNKNGVPPRNSLWVPPVGLRMALRTILRYVNVSVVSTMDDHHQEVIAYLRENNCNGLIADDAEYIAFDPPRLFSAKLFKLTYKGRLESREYVVSELKTELNLSSEKLCILIALLGNYLIPENQLKDVYERAGVQIPEENHSEILVSKLSAYLNGLKASENLDAIVNEILNSPNDARATKLKQSIQYYLDGTQDGFLKYRSSNTGGKPKHGKGKSGKTVISEETNLNELDMDTSKLASENAEDEKSMLKMYQERTSSLTAGQSESIEESCSSTSGGFNGSYMSSECDDIVASAEGTSQVNNGESSGISKPAKESKEVKPPVLPPVAHEIMRTVSERHSKGLMSPLIYQILSQGEIKLPVLMEDLREIPSIYEFYKPIRQKVYAVVFNLYHHRFMSHNKDSKKDKSEPPVDIRIREYIWTKNFNSQKEVYVAAEAVGWAVPTIQRLWFGTTIEDKRRRLRAFLTCMRSDSMLMLNPDFVPQHLLIAATVLRYMMSFPNKLTLRKPELDAFIVAAVSPELIDPDITQKLEVPVITSRGVQLAAMFMHGVEMALLVNDACGSPIPWLMSCPWLFFDGKLFQHVYYRAGQVKNLHELCDGRVDLVMVADRVKKAILEGLNVQFARPAQFNFTAGDGPKFYPKYNQSRGSDGSSHVSSHRPPLGNSNLRYGRRSETGAQLEVAGVVVGSWGSNFNTNSPYGNMRSYNALAPHFSSPQSRLNSGVGGGYNLGSYGRLGRGSYSRQSSTPIGKGRGAKFTKKKSTPKKSGGRGMTVVAPSGKVVLADQINLESGEGSSGVAGSSMINGGCGDASVNDKEQFEDAVGTFNGEIA